MIYNKNMKVDNMKFYSLEMKIPELEIVAEIVEVYTTFSETYNKCCEIIGTDSVEFVDYTDEIAILVDESGLYKSNNVLFEIKLPQGGNIKLAGKMLFVRNIENEFSTDIGGLSLQDILSLRENLDIKIIGMTKGV